MFKYNKIYSLMLSAGLVLAHTSIHAYTVMDEVVVSASKEGTEIRKTPATIHKVTEEELDRDKPVFFGDVVNRVPGAYMNNLGAEQHMATMRQPLAQTGVYLYLEDGVPLRPVGLYDHNQTYLMNGNAIRDIEVIKGPASSLYGSYATGGLMNFLTKPPSSAFESMVGVQGTNRGYRRADFSIAGVGDSKDHALRLSGYHYAQKDGWARHSDADKIAISLRHDADLGSSAVLKTVLNYADLYMDQGGGVLEEQWNAGQIGESPHTFTYKEIKDIRLTSSYEREFVAGGLSTFTVFLRDNNMPNTPTWRTSITSASDCPAQLRGTNNIANEAGKAWRTQNFTPTLNTDYGCGGTYDQKYKSYGIDLRHRQNLGSNGSRVVLGVTFDRSSMSQNEQKYAFTGVNSNAYRQVAGVRETLRDFSVDTDVSALYAQGEFVISKELLAVVGARFDTLTYDYVRSAAQTSGVSSRKNTYSGLSPKLGVVYSPAANTNYFANLSTGFAPPEIGNKYGGLSEGQVEEVKTQNIEFGARHKLAELPVYLDATAYQLNMKNAIYNHTVRATAHNADTRHRGFELGVGYDSGRFFSARFSATVTEQKYTSAQRNCGTPPAGLSNPCADQTGKRVRLAPDGIANLLLNFRLAPKTVLGVETQYLGSYSLDEANTRTYGGHTVHHLRLTHQNGPIEYWLAVRNISDNQYAEFVSFSRGTTTGTPTVSYNPGAPRTVLAGVRYNFGGKAK